MSDHSVYDTPPRGLDSARRGSNLLRMEAADALSIGAENLLTKAVTAHRLGEQEKADSLITRACKLPYDESMGIHTGPWGAHMLLFNKLSDALEDSPEDDSDWLDLALAIFSELDAAGQLDLATCLRTMADDDGNLSERERQRVHDEVPKGPFDTPPYLPRDASLDMLVAETTSIVAAVAAYEHGLAAKRAQAFAQWAIDNNLE